MLGPAFLWHKCIKIYDGTNPAKRRGFSIIYCGIPVYGSKRGLGLSLGFRARYFGVIAALLAVIC